MLVQRHQYMQSSNGRDRKRSDEGNSEWHLPSHRGKPKDDQVGLFLHSTAFRPLKPAVTSQRRIKGKTGEDTNTRKHGRIIDLFRILRRVINQLQSRVWLKMNFSNFLGVFSQVSTHRTLTSHSHNSSGFGLIRPLCHISDECVCPLKNPVPAIHPKVDLNHSVKCCLFTTWHQHRFAVLEHTNRAVILWEADQDTSFVILMRLILCFTYLFLPRRHHLPYWWKTVQQRK